VEKQTEKTEKMRILRNKRKWRKDGNVYEGSIQKRQRNMKKIYNGKSRENGRKGME
jgi:hypothetical protein